MAAPPSARKPQDLLAKGMNFRGFVRAVERLHGAEMVPRIIEAVAVEEARDALRYGRIVPTGWYPVAWHCALHEAAQKVTGAGRDLARQIGYEGTRDDLGGVYRYIAAMLAPQTLVRLGNSLWSSYWQGGVVQTVEHGRGHIRTSFTECWGFDQNSWADITGSCEAILELAGAKDLRVKALEGGGARSPDLVLDAVWTM